MIQHFRLLLFIALCISAVQVSAQNILGFLEIGDGTTITNNADKKVTLRLGARGATQMQISNNPSFAGARWEPFALKKDNWILAGEDGIKNVYAKFRNDNGNVSETVVATVELDRSPPIGGELFLDGGQRYSNDKTRRVKISVNATDATQVRLSPRPDFAGSSWQPYREDIGEVRLPGLDGEKVVYAKFRDQAGNETEPVEASIIIDTKPPENPKITIDNGEEYAKSRKVKLRLYAEGADLMQIRGMDDWVPYQEEMEWELPEGDGEKVIVARFADKAGNTSAVVHDNIKIDSQAPMFGKITINGGARYTNRFDNNKLQIIGMGATQMLISNNPGFGGATWRSFSNLVPNWALDSDDGKKTVYIKFKDAAGNQSPVFETSITLDSTPPQNPVLKIDSDQAEYDEEVDAIVLSDANKVVDLLLGAEGAKYMMIANTGSFYGASWEVYTPKKEGWELSGETDGERFVFAKFRDRSGNESGVASIRILVDTQAPVDTKLAIDNNAPYVTNKEKKVILSLFARGASQMQISNDPTFGSSDWEPYNISKEWVLDGEDGIKNVWVRYKDNAENTSAPIADDVILDRQPPQNPSIIVNRGEEKTNHPNKLVVVKVRADEAKFLRLSTDPTFNNARWAAYTEQNTIYQLPGQDGEKQVYVQFKDEAGNLTEPVADDIILDRTPPITGDVVIDDGSQLTNNTDNLVKLNLSAKGAAEMIISNDFYFNEAEWETYATEKKWRLVGGDGLKTVYVRFRDEVGNVSKVAYASIGVDQTAPKQGRVMVNKGGRYVTDLNGYVTLKLYARDAKQMVVAQNENFTGANWQPYEQYIQNYLLEGEDGPKNLYVKFRDDAGNITQPLIVNLVLDRQEPYNEKIELNNGEKYTNTTDNRVTLNIRAADAKEMIISNSPGFNYPAKWQPYQEGDISWLLFGNNGEKRVYAKFRDEAGNESGVATDEIILDTEPPIPRRLLINGKNTTTSAERVTLTIQATGASQMMISNDPKFEGALWEPYAESKSWDVTPGEGLKMVYVKFKDEANNISEYKWAEITLVR